MSDHVEVVVDRCLTMGQGSDTLLYSLEPIGEPMEGLSMSNEIIWNSSLTRAMVANLTREQVQELAETLDTVIEQVCGDYDLQK